MIGLFCDEELFLLPNVRAMVGLSKTVMLISPLKSDKCVLSKSTIRPEILARPKALIVSMPSFTETPLMESVMIRCLGKANEIVDLRAKQIG